ncbi:type II toxin-antitoxin system Phd/YefM family antitoxin [Cryptosporangium arvum]|uniref:type II toxin-antitoxin system Phd/YefM family antitoxin n=1 Tax=Cryptosporangium arvum TaxID=80871 RepID=UPI00056837CA|nr:prevent-host-death family protein [Cryptosporangium arvum]
MALLHDPHQVSVTEAAQRGVAGLVAEAEAGADVVVTRRHQPVAVLVSFQRLEQIDTVLSDLHDLALVLARSATDTGHRTSIDDVLTAFGHTRESLAASGDDEH